MSDVRPPKPPDIKLTMPLGTIETKYLTVLQDLYADHVCVCFNADTGFSISISRQSMMEVTELKRALKAKGRLALMTWRTQLPVATQSGTHDLHKTD